MTISYINKLTNDTVTKFKLGDFLKEPLKKHCVRIDWMCTTDRNMRMSTANTHLITLAYTVRPIEGDKIIQETLRIDTRYRYDYIGYGNPYITHVYIDKEPGNYPLLFFKHSLRDVKKFPKIFTLNKLIQKWREAKVRLLNVKDEDLEVAPYFDWVFMSETEAHSIGVKHIAEIYSEKAKYAYRKKIERTRNAKTRV